MRKAVQLWGAAILLSPSILAAQAQTPASAPVIVQFDAAGRPIDPNRQPTCLERRAQDEARFAEESARRAAAGEPALEQPAQRQCLEFRVVDQSASAATPAQPGPIESSFSWSLPAASSANSETAFVTRRSPPARQETAEEFYNRPRAAAGSTSFDEAVAAREGTYSRSTFASTELGNGTIENETRQTCTETLFERTCSSGGSVTFSSGDDGGAAARALLESLRGDD